MILLIILGLISIVGSILYARSESWDMFDDFTSGLLFSGVLLGMVFLLVQLFTYEGSLTKRPNITTQKIVSLNDGTGIEGRFSGGLFVMSGYINDTQHFAYYRELAPNTYMLEKRNATTSAIHTDATPETAHLDLSEEVTICKRHWYNLCDEKPHVTFIHANFHVPPNSVQNTFNLDAQ